ncbi:Amino acid transporter [Parasponia andersonii]|uniref:Amino acid transporter n=1 Tax=Parasponia andersonii TaxID=3476 RepID=A0A2P5CB96_PARAD|nr:Amino acid transporter [Parasponia andersonii]
MNCQEAEAERMESQNQTPQTIEPAKGTTILKTCFNGINALSGVGILSIPYALSQGGWLSLILLFSVAILCWYTGLLLKRCMDSNPHIKTYPDIGEAAFGPKGRALISLFMYLELYLVAVEFLILEGDNLHKLFHNTRFKIGGLRIRGQKGFMMLSALVILPTTWLRSLGMLAYVSAGGVLASAILVGCVFWAGAVDGVGFHEEGELLNFGGLPTTISLFVFCYGGHAVFPTLCNSMKDRSQFSKVLIVCFVISTISYGSMAILGYLMFGDYLEFPVTLNLPIRKISSQIAICTTVINPLTKYAVIISPIAAAIEDKYSIQNNRAISFIIRTLIVLSTLIVALLVPFFGYVMAFIGAFLSVTVSMLLPCLFYLKINKVARRFGLELVMIGGIVATGSFVGVFGTYTSLKQILKQIHAFSIKTHLQYDISVLIRLINFCTIDPTPASMDHAHHLFDQIPQPDIVVFNMLARGYARSETPLGAIPLFAHIFSADIVPDEYTFPALLKVCASSKALEEGKQLHCLAIKHGLNLNIYVCPTLINMYTACNDVHAARRVFDKIKEPCIVMYNAIITGYARNSLPNEALASFRGLQASNVKPTDVTMLSVLSSCALLGALDLGRWVHEYVKKNGFDNYVKVNTALIDMYAKCGSLEDSESVFENMSLKDTQAWSAMIVAYAIHGQSSKAISMFERMKRERVKPDEITFLGLLYACSHTGLVEEGCKYFYSMSDKYGIIPSIKHYGCMVDLLSRSGRLEEAFKFIDKLPIRPTPVLWRTLLSACSSHGNVELGKAVIKRVFELDDSHGGDYVILSNLCATAGRWEDVDFLRKMMKDKGVVKIPGCSSIEVKNVVHEFFSGDGERFVSTELHRTLDELVEELKLAGYVPDISLVSHDMEDHDKEIILRYHSEKLAIAYGLLNTPAGTTIRVVKNLRVCGDCHSAAKYISLVSQRRIILRDVQRFHHFKEGKCSCGDYW